MATLRPQIALREIARLVRSNVLLSAANFAAGLLLARVLGAESRGEVAFVILWSNTLSTAAIAGLPLYLSRLAARTPEESAAVYRLARRMAIAGTLIGWIGLSAFILLADRWSSVQPDGPSWTLAAMSMPLSIWMALQLQIEVGRGNLRTWIACLATFAYAQLVLLAALAAFGLFTVHTCLAATVVATAVAILFAQRRISHRPSKQATIDGEAWWRPLVAGRRDNYATWLSLAASSADRLVVSLAFPAQALGDYVVMSSVAHLQNLVCEAIAPAMFADVAGSVSHDAVVVAGVARRLRQTVLVSAFAGLALAAIMPFVVPAVYGRQYGGDNLLIITITAATSVRAMTRPFEEVLRAKDRAVEQSMVSTSVVIFFAIFCAGPAAWSYLPGVALGMLMANAIGLVMLARTVARGLRVPPIEILMPRPADLMAMIHELRPAL